MTLANVCEHGSLRRSCLVCELENTIITTFEHSAGLKAEVEQLTSERDEARKRIAALEAALADMCELAVAAAATAFDDTAEAGLRERIAAALALLEEKP